MYLFIRTILSESGFNWIVYRNLTYVHVDY